MAKVSPAKIVACSDKLFDLCMTELAGDLGRQNERDRAMVKDPPIDLEEVVVGIWSPGSIPRP